MRIYLVRHGQTDWNKAKKIQGRHNISLNACGREMAEQAAEKLSDVVFDAAFCSPLNRARETARIILGDQQELLKPEERLAEIAFGVEEGRERPRIEADPSDPVYNFFCDPAHYLPPEGAETFESVYRRTGAFMEDLKTREHDFGTVLLVAHAVVNRTILNPIAGIALRDFWKIKLPNCAISILELKDGEYRILDDGSAKSVNGYATREH